MSDLHTKMLQTIIDSVAGVRKYIDESVDGLKSELKTDIMRLEQKIDKVDKRVDNLGKHLAYLEDDASTRSEYRKLVTRVDKVEHKLAQI
jgi:chromosome segregation ATPase